MHLSRRLPSTLVGPMPLPSWYSMLPMGCLSWSKPSLGIISLAAVVQEGRLVTKKFHLEICASFFGHMYEVLNVVKQ